MRHIQINLSDNVAVALVPLAAGEEISVADTVLVLSADIPQGHKFALCNISTGGDVIKYGFPIGHVTKDIRAGELIDEKCLKTNLAGKSDYTYNPKTVEMPKPDSCPTFRGYRRKDGRVGIRNEIWIVPTVGCINGVASRLAHKAQTEHLADGLDGIFTFNHQYGCSQLGDDHENTRKILADIIRHPNAGGVLVVGLGCENNQPSELEKLLGEYDHSRIKFLVTQQSEDEIEEGLRLIEQLCDNARKYERTDCPISSLVVGLKCGGSDGLSGITANPLVGRFSDKLIACGGSTVLTEVPEMFGAETLLMDRCANKETFDKAVDMINSFKDYFISNRQPIYENPSPGNKRGGISTLEEKSLGCTQKAGSATVMDVLSYGDRVKTRGLNLLWGPGNDIVATTALAAAGCQLILFTTGRGTPLGSFVPTVKIATNTTLSHTKPHWIDFNAGSLVDDALTDTAAATDQLMALVVEIASGLKTANEKNECRDMAIFKSGVTL